MINNDYLKFEKKFDNDFKTTIKFYEVNEINIFNKCLIQNFTFYYGCKN